MSQRARTKYVYDLTDFARILDSGAHEVSRNVLICLMLVYLLLVLQLVHFPCPIGRKLPSVMVAAAD